MNGADRELCRFCLKIIQDQNFDIVGDITLEILNSLSIKMDLGRYGNSPMCGDCQVTIERCFNFKSTCLYSEDIIAEYITEGSQLVLEEFYSEQILSQRSNQIPKGYKVCRLCMKITAKYLTSADEVFTLTIDKLQKCVPELNLNVVKHPAICERCLVDLQSYSEFVSNCLNVEKKINEYCKTIGIDKKQVQLYNVLQYILNEKSDISRYAVSRVGKLDEDQLTIGINCTEFHFTEVDIKMETNEGKSEDHNKGCSSKRVNKNIEIGLCNGGQVQFVEVDQFIQSDNINCNKKTYDFDTEDKHETSLSRMIKREAADEFKMKTEINEVKSEDHNISCSGTRIENNIEIGLCNGGQVRCPEADDCQSASINRDKETYNLDTKDKHETLFLSRMIKREDADQNQSQLYTEHNFMDEVVAEIYPKNEQIDIKSEEADMSDIKKYESQDNNFLRNKSHKSKCNKNKQTRKKAFCKLCSSSYGEKYVLSTRKLCIHGGGSQVRLYECDQCSFVTAYRHNLTDHKKVHMNVAELKLYSCKACEFKTKYKCNIKPHFLARHQGSDLPVLNKHIPTHNSEIEMYSCSLCSYKTKLKNCLKYHEMTHKDKSELSTYDCFHCPYKAKRKTNLRRHMTIHKSLSELRSGQGSTSNFLTRDESRVSNHLLVHKDHSETQLYCCDKCIFKTKRKSNLKNHMSIHMDSSKLKKYKCAICPYQATSKSNLQRHSVIHPEVKQTALTVYKCMHCTFQTSDKHHYKEHLHIHNDKNLGEIPMLKCLLCSYQTIRKRDLERHVQLHRKSSDTELWQCETCGGKYNKFYVKRHQRICIGQVDVRPYDGGNSNKRST